MLRPLALAAALTLTTATAALADNVPSLSLQATGTATRTPDMASVQLSVVREAKTASEALRQNSSAMASVLKEMKAQGIEDRDLRTSNFNIRPIYEQIKKSQRQPRTPRIIAYQVTNGLSVRVRNLDALGSILDRAVSLGVNSGGGISFGSSQADEAIKEARANAVKAALEKAQTIVDAANISLGRITNISENGLQYGGHKLERARAQSFQDEEVPIASGENTYSVNVNVQWEITQ